MVAGCWLGREMGIIVWDRWYVMIAVGLSVYCWGKALELVCHWVAIVVEDVCEGEGVW